MLLFLLDQILSDHFSTHLVRIVVTGMTGAGKSTFINTLIPEAKILIGEYLNSRTVFEVLTLITETIDPRVLQLSLTAPL